MAENNRRQAFLIDGAVMLDNERGTAPGQWIEDNGRVLMLLPGPPREMKGVWEAQCESRLHQLLPAQVIRTRFLRIAGIGESDLDQLIAPVYTKYTNPVTTVLAAPGDVQVHLRARCATAEEGDALLQEVGDPIEALLGDRIYSRNGDPLEAVVGQKLRERGATLVVAESCTGGMLAERITSVAGSSDYFVGGFLTYTYEAKQKMLGVPTEMLQQYKAVSEPVARAMAEGAARETGATYGVSVW
jgi:nicotinamide-nucleotide amidase